MLFTKNFSKFPLVSILPIPFFTLLCTVESLQEKIDRCKRAHQAAMEGGMLTTLFGFKLDDITCSMCSSGKDD